MTEVRLYGLREGSRAVAGVVYEMSKKDKPAEEILEEIKKFCETSLGVTEKVPDLKQ